MSVVIQNLPSHAVTLTGPGGPPSCPQPSEEDPFAWDNIPAEFGMARGIGGGTGFTMNAKDAAFTISCKSTDATHAWMHAKRAGQQASKLTPGWAGEVLTWYRGDTGETFVGTGCLIEAAPAGASTQEPQAVQWRILVASVTIQGPSLIPIVGAP
jgi:hypothetical protein